MRARDSSCFNAGMIQWRLVYTLGAILALGACGDDGATVASDDDAVSPDGATGDDTTNPGSGEDPEGGDPPIVGSAGCGVAVEDAAETWIENTLTVGDTERRYYQYLPPDYEPTRAYPVVYQFHGCSTNPERQNNNPPVQDASGADAIHIRGRAEDNCWTTTVNSPDLVYFETLVTEVESSLCADPERRSPPGTAAAPS
ncbi:MAG: hypothetical protein AAGA56_06955 [Myxococcota bacterium]